MKMKLEVPLSICILASSDRKDYVSRNEVIEYFQKQIDKLEDSIKHSDNDVLVEKSKERLISKKGSVEKVKSIDDWDDFFKRVLEGDYNIGGQVE